MATTPVKIQVTIKFFGAPTSGLSSAPLGPAQRFVSVSKPKEKSKFLTKLSQVASSRLGRLVSESERDYH